MALEFAPHYLHALDCLLETCTHGLPLQTLKNVTGAEYGA